MRRFAIVLALTGCHAQAGATETPGTPALATVGSAVVSLAEFAARMKLYEGHKVMSGENGRRRAVAGDLVREEQLRQACRAAGIPIDPELASRRYHFPDDALRSTETEATRRAEDEARLCEDMLTERSNGELSFGELQAQLDRDYPVHYAITLTLPPNRRKAKRQLARERAMLTADRSSAADSPHARASRR
jgi:hypothetical protein